MRLGKLSVNVLKRSVLKQIKQRRREVVSGAGIGEDCAIFAFPEGETVSCVAQAALKAEQHTGAVAAHELIAEEGAVGERILANQEPTVTMSQLLQRCVNKLVAYGAEPVGVMLALALPTEFEEPELKDLIRAADAKCKELNLEITGVQTNVTQAVCLPLATVTGMGRRIETGEAKRRKAVPGQDVVISKWIGLEGTAVLAKENREKLLTRYPAYLVEEAAGFDKYLSTIPEAAIAGKSGVCAMQGASEGGIFTCLWELAEKAGVGLTIDMRKLPLRQETVEVCELCGVNPYELMSGGCLVMLTQDGSDLVAALHAADIPAVMVGKVTDSKDRILLNGEEVRYMEKPPQDELYKVQYNYERKDLS